MQGGLGRGTKGVTCDLCMGRFQPPRRGEYCSTLPAVRKRRREDEYLYTCGGGLDLI